MAHRIISIGRQFRSGGHEIGVEWGRKSEFDLYFNAHAQRKEEIVQTILNAYAKLG